MTRTSKLLLCDSFPVDAVAVNMTLESLPCGLVTFPFDEIISGLLLDHEIFTSSEIRIFSGSVKFPVT